MSRDHRIVELEQKLDQLKHEYELFLSGNRRTEPVQMKNMVEREVLLITRFPSSSTVFKFQVKTLAMRFRSLEKQMKNLIDLRDQRRLAAERYDMEPNFQDVVVDAMAIDNPALIAARVRVLLLQAGAKGSVPPELTPEALSSMMVSKARGVVGKGNVKAVRYVLVASESGPKVKGEIISVEN